jgi:ABC-type transporter Mla subunit MlaD
MNAQESLKSAVQQLHAMTAELKQFISDSEKVFLDAGSKLHILQIDANNLLNSSAQAISMGQSNYDPAAELRDGLERLDKHLEEGQSKTERGLQVLTGVLAGINNLSALESDFQTIVATLHALASTTHLENSRRDTINTGFDSVVTDLRQMAADIKPKFNEVLEQSRDVRMTAEAGLHQAKTFLDRHRRDVSRFRRETQTHLHAMTETCATSSVLADKSTQSVAAVKTSIESVLQSLQIQDLARQMIEHVVQDLDEFSAGAERAWSDERVEEAQSWLAELTIVTRVEAAQVANVSDRLLSCLAQIDRNIQSIVVTLSSIAKESLGFSGKKNGSSLLRSLERGIRGTSETLCAHDAQEEAMLRALARVSTTAEGVEALVDEVASFGRDARFVGLNAMVKAVHVGQSGVTLRVLAREVQEVADQIEDFTTAAAKIMRSVGSDAHMLVDETSSVLDPSTRAGAAVAANLEGLMGQLGAYQSALDATVDSLLSGSATLRSEVSNTSKSLHGLMASTKGLRELSLRLTKMQTDALAGARGAKPPTGRTHDDDWYTMEDERRVQRTALGLSQAKAENSPKPADVSSAEGSVEFF